MVRDGVVVEEFVPAGHIEEVTHDDGGQAPTDAGPAALLTVMFPVPTKLVSRDRHQNVIEIYVVMKGLLSHLFVCAGGPLLSPSIWWQMASVVDTTHPLAAPAIIHSTSTTTKASLPQADPS